MPEGDSRQTVGEGIVEVTADLDSFRRSMSEAIAEVSDQLRDSLREALSGALEGVVDQLGTDVRNSIESAASEKLNIEVDINSGEAPGSEDVIAGGRDDSEIIEKMDEIISSIDNLVFTSGTP